MSAGVTGMDDVLGRLDKLERDLRGSAVRTGLSAASEEARKHVLTNARHEFYTGDTTEKGHPRELTGNLINSIQAASSLDGKQSAVFVGAEYGGYLEMGTSTGIRPRHYVKRGVLEHLPEIRRAFVQSVKRVLGT